MRGSLYNENTEAITEFKTLEKLIKHMGDLAEIAANDPMNTNEPEFEFMGYEGDCAYFNQR